MTFVKIRNSTVPKPLEKQQTKINQLSLEQQKALGDLALIGGPAFIIGLWGITAFASGVISALRSIA